MQKKYSVCFLEKRCNTSGLCIFFSFSLTGFPFVVGGWWWDAFFGRLRARRSVRFFFKTQRWIVYENNFDSSFMLSKTKKTPQIHFVCKFILIHHFCFFELFAPKKINGEWQTHAMQRVSTRFVGRSVKKNALKKIIVGQFSKTVGNKLIEYMSSTDSLRGLAGETQIKMEFQFDWVEVNAKLTSTGIWVQKAHDQFTSGIFFHLNFDTAPGP